MSASKFKLALVASASVALLAACNAESDGRYRGAAPSPEMVEESVAVSGDFARKASPPPPPQGEAPQGGIFLAYSYSMGISAPKGAIAPLMDAHQQACVEAGPAVCQVLGSSVNRWGEDQVSAYLNIRAEPEWLATLRSGIASDAEKSGGKITANTVSTEDLTRYITDTDARLEAKIALRDRIRILLETNEGSLSDVLQAERALADVQGEIDSMTAQLSAARARVAMSSLNISYQSDPETSVGLFKPLRVAFGDFGRMSVSSLADAVRFVAKSWPFFIVGMIVLMILRGWWRGRKRA